jgi:excisionase family DNA binding protein
VSDLGAVLRAEIEQLVAEEVARQLPGLRAELAERNRASPFLTIPEAAEWLRTSRGTIDNLLSAGVLNRHKVGRRTLIERTELEAYVRRQQ